jgi:hypothetical protein
MQQGSPCLQLVKVKGVGQECPTHTPTLVVLLLGYHRDLGEPEPWD